MSDAGPKADLPPNELGEIMVLEYHLVGEKEARWERERTVSRPAA